MDFPDQDPSERQMKILWSHIFYAMLIESNHKEIINAYTTPNINCFSVQVSTFLQSSISVSASPLSEGMQLATENRLSFANSSICCVMNDKE